MKLEEIAEKSETTQASLASHSFSTQMGVSDYLQGVSPASKEALAQIKLTLKHYNEEMVA